jgi:hypothetical protein
MVSLIIHEQDPIHLFALLPHRMGQSMTAIVKFSEVIQKIHLISAGIITTRFRAEDLNLSI